MATIRFHDVTRHFAGAAEPAVAGVDLDIADHETVALVGPPGSGKTTLLRLVAGLEAPDRGRVVLGDPSGGGQPVEVVLLFQNYAIYPHLSVRDNVATPPQGGTDRSRPTRRSTRSSTSSASPTWRNARRHRCRRATGCGWRSRGPWRGVPECC